MHRRLLLTIVMSIPLLLALACSDDDGSPDGSGAAQAPASTDTARDGQGTLIPIDPTKPSAAAEDTPTGMRPTSTPAPDCPQAIQTGLTLNTTVVDGLERRYRLYVPASYDASAPVPLLLNFHGLGSNALEQELYSGFTQLAEREGFVLVSPDGTGLIQEWHVLATWLPGYVDDIDFVDALIDEVTKSVCIDEERIYAAGLSNGGAIASLLGCNLDRIAAIATVAGAPFSSRRCEPDRPVPVIAFHGTYDGVVPFNLGEYLGAYLPLTNVRQDMQSWAENNGCNTAPQIERIAQDVTLEAYTNCDAGADVRLYVVEGGGHTWPGSDHKLWFLGDTTQSIDASELIWSFFEEER
jgi:polyhydroxybutyrate depolymerase